MSEPAGGPGAARARLKLTPLFRDLLRRVVERVQGAVAADPNLVEGLGLLEPPDQDLLEALTAELHEGAAQDAGEFAKLLARPEFGQAEIALSTEQVEAVVRGSVQVRLRLHERVLHGMSSAELDGGKVFFKLSPAEQQAYACYRVLAFLEEDLLRQLNGEAE